MTDHARDPGLQPERTFLAWRRTALALFVVALLVARSAMVADSTWDMAVSCLALIDAGLLWKFAMIRRGNAMLYSTRQPSAPPAGLLLITVATCILVCASLLIAGPPR
ncbi:DUF202 domain-containing protein [Cupriavidus sp. NPDC089707]|uniref:DUF202 domain-containing protein n=1 Tax=Cupriavidus sp. NPDC089707 TaxID=3363963 RepID=UPI0038027FC0